MTEVLVAIPNIGNYSELIKTVVSYHSFNLTVVKDAATALKSLQRDSIDALIVNPFLPSGDLDPSLRGEIDETWKSYEFSHLNGFYANGLAVLNEAKKKVPHISVFLEREYPDTFYGILFQPVTSQEPQPNKVLQPNVVLYTPSKGNILGNLKQVVIDMKEFFE